MAKIDFPDFKSESNSIHKNHHKEMAKLLAELNQSKKPLRKISKRLRDLYSLISKQRKLAKFRTQTETVEQKDELTSNKPSKRMR